MLRLSIIIGSIVAMLAISGCGVWRGNRDVDTEPPDSAIGDGPGLLTGKRGGMVIFQK